MTAPMTATQVFIWIVVGLAAGWLASAVMGGGLGVLGDIVLGIVGAVLGSLLFRTLGWHSPFEGIIGVVFVAFIGAALLLLVMRLVRGRGRLSKA